MPIGKKLAGMGLTVPPGTNLHVGKKSGKGGSHFTTTEELESR